MKKHLNVKHMHSLLSEVSLCGRHTQNKQVLLAYFSHTDLLYQKSQKERHMMEAHNSIAYSTGGSSQRKLHRANGTTKGK